MEEIIYKIIFVFFLILMIFIRMPHSTKYKKIEKCLSKKEKREKLLVALNGISMMFVPLIYVFTGWLDFFKMNLPDWIRIIGIVIIFLCLIFLWWIHKILGENWSPVLEIRKGHKLIIKGPYKYVRHPMYTLFYIFAIGLLLSISNWFVGLFALLSWHLLYVVRISTEEKMMFEQFGIEWENYCKRTTKKIIPYIY